MSRGRVATFNNVVAPPGSFNIIIADHDIKNDIEPVRKYIQFDLLHDRTGINRYSIYNTLEIAEQNPKIPIIKKSLSNCVYYYQLFPCK
jgi:hypothetical protein